MDIVNLRCRFRIYEQPEDVYDWKLVKIQFKVYLEVGDKK